MIEPIVVDALHTASDDESTAWTTLSMADKHGVGKGTVGRIWRARRLRPWQVDTFKVSSDPDFESKLVYVVGLHMNPPERVVAFSFDENPQCQAVVVTQPSLLMKLGRVRMIAKATAPSICSRRSIATGEVLHQTRKRHTEDDVAALL